MRKFTFYILILIILAGLFNPIKKVTASAYTDCLIVGDLTQCKGKEGDPGPTLYNPYVLEPFDTTKMSETSTLTGETKTVTVPKNTPIIKSTDTKYTLLAPLPCENGAGCENGQLKTYDPTQNNNIGGYLNLMIKLFIGICAVLAVIMIVWGGIEYMTTELISSKEAGKERIIHAILGLLLALGAWTLLNTINPDLLNTDLESLTAVTVSVTLADQIKQYTGQGTCTPVADSSNPCSPESLASAGFTNATQASSICNGESKGTATLASTVDKGSDGNSFSLGLFQINILAHANEIPGGVCSGIFTIDPNPPGKVGNSQNDNTLGGCLQRNGTICVKYAAVVTNQVKYQSCKNYITNPTNNIAYAAKLQTSRNWGQWGANNSCKYS